MVSSISGQFSGTVGKFSVIVHGQIFRSSRQIFRNCRQIFRNIWQIFSTCFIYVSNKRKSPLTELLVKSATTASVCLKVSFVQLGFENVIFQYWNLHYFIILPSTVPLSFRAGPVKIATSHNFNVTFQCEVNGYPRPTIRWYKDAKEITNNDKTVRKGNNLVITTVWVKDEGIYQCTANNGIEMIHQAASLIVGGLLCNIIIKFILIIFKKAIVFWSRL